MRTIHVCILRGICCQLISLRQGYADEFTDKQRDRLHAAYRRLILVLKEHTDERTQNTDPRV